MTSLKSCASGLMIVSSILSGCLWVVAANAKVRKTADQGLGGIESSGITISSDDRKGKYDYIATAKRQSMWNSGAAWLAALAAFSQAAQAYLPD